MSHNVFPGSANLSRKDTNEICIRKSKEGILGLSLNIYNCCKGYIIALRKTVHFHFKFIANESTPKFAHSAEQWLHRICY